MTFRVHIIDYRFSLQPLPIVLIKVNIKINSLRIAIFPTKSEKWTNT